jgi:hypothetical protein
VRPTKIEALNRPSWPQPAPSRSSQSIPPRRRPHSRPPALAAPRRHTRHACPRRTAHAPPARAAPPHGRGCRSLTQITVSTITELRHARSPSVHAALVPRCEPPRLPSSPTSLLPMLAARATPWLARGPLSRCSAAPARGHGGPACRARGRGARPPSYFVCKIVITPHLMLMGAVACRARAVAVVACRARGRARAVAAVTSLARNCSSSMPNS